MFKKMQHIIVSEMDKEDAIQMYNGILLSHKKELMPSVVMWMDPESVILSEVS